MTFSVTLKKLREEHNLTITTISKKLKIPFSTYQGWEKGALPRKAEHYKNLCIFFQISLEHLMFGRLDADYGRNYELLLKNGKKETLLLSFKGEVRQETLEGE